MIVQKTGLLVSLSKWFSRLFGIRAHDDAAVATKIEVTVYPAVTTADASGLPKPANATAPAKVLATIVEEYSAVAAAEPADLGLATRHKVPDQLSLKLRSVGRINRQKRRSKTRSTVVAAKGAKATPRPVAQTRKAAKRTPDLYPMKRRSPVAKKPKLKVLAERPRARASAIIIPLPLTPRAVARLKLRKAA